MTEACGGRDTDVCVQARHVVNYDFPDFMSDYIHRIGRVGRVGSLGASFALSFVSKKWEVELLWKIEVSYQLSEYFNNSAAAAAAATVV